MQTRLLLGQWLVGRWAKPTVFVLALLPLVWLILAAVMDWLGANPAEAIERSTGDWTLRMLCVMLAITPIRKMSGLSALARFRRMTGLFVYFYGVLHLLAYSWFDMGFDVDEIGEDILKRPFILVGFVAVVLLTPLALTSFNKAVKAIGSQRWRLLHRLVYLIAVLGVVHFFWMRAGKRDFNEVAAYALLLGGLLTLRLRYAIQRSHRG
jgi:sulfoxide reductase heme-binding subunit YedZ